MILNRETSSKGSHYFPLKNSNILSKMHKTNLKKYKKAYQRSKLLNKVDSKILEYRNDPKFLDTYAWANSADPDQTAGAV